MAEGRGVRWVKLAVVEKTIHVNGRCCSSRYHLQDMLLDEKYSYERRRRYDQ